MTIPTCNKCKEEREETLFRKRKLKATSTFLYTCKICIPCERALTKKHQQENREYWREICKKTYSRWTDEYRAKRLMESHKRHRRLKQVLWDQELTDLVTEEAHDLRVLRKQATGIEWHVDHIIPLNGKTVSGLHVWNNLQVIPKHINLQKKNHFKEL